MLTRLMKCVSIATLILAALFWSYAQTYERVFGFVIGMGAVLVAVQATRARKYGWAIGFYAVAVVFNPVLPTGVFSGKVAFCIVVATVALFAYSLYALKTQPLLSVPSITDRNPGSRSL